MPRPLTPEFMVNTWYDTWQDNPDVTTLANGNIVVVWDSLMMVDSGDYQYVAAQIFRPDGSRVGGELVLSDPGLVANHARVTALADGGFAVAWEAGQASVLNPTDIYTATYSATGTQRSPIRLVSQPQDNEFFAAEVVARPGGGYSVIWSRDRAQPNEDVFNASDSFLRNYDANGAPVSGTLPVNTYTFADQHNVRGAALTNGNTVLVWESEHEGTSPYALPDDVRARILDPMGRPITPEILIADDPNGPNGGIALTGTDVDVAALSGGRFVVTWVETVLDGQPNGNTAFRVYGRIFGPDGAPQGGAFAVNQFQNSVPNHTAVTGLANGGFVVTWDIYAQELSDDAGTDVFGQYFSDFGARIGGNFLVNQWRGATQEWSALTPTRNGGFFVAYQSEFLYDDDSDEDIGGRFFSGPTWAEIGLGGFGRATAGHDRISGSAGADRMAGLAGNDLLTGLSGHDLLLGGPGNDSLNGGLGRDTLDGGAGIDTAIFATDAAVRVNLGIRTAQVTGQGNDMLLNIENVTSGAGRDVLTGNAANNHLSSGAGADTLNGGLGHDILNGGAGADRMIGGAGNDTYAIDNAADRVIETANGGTDRIISDIGIDLNRAGGVYAHVEHVTLTGPALRAYGNAANNSLQGNAANNLLQGRYGNDQLAGGVGNDTLQGDQGHDTLAGQTGNDMLWGGAGNDSFIFQRGADRDTVADFQNDLDTVRLVGLGVSNVAQARDHATQQGANVVFDFGQGDVLTIRNTTIGALQDDLLFT